MNSQCKYLQEWDRVTNVLKVWRYVEKYTVGLTLLPICAVIEDIEGVPQSVYNRDELLVNTSVLE